MDVVQFSLGLYSILILIRGLVGSYVIDIRPKSGIWDTTERPCHKKCKYGYHTDVEGNRMCKCLDPCTHIFCPFEGTRCVVRKSEKCKHGNCKYEATCKRVFDWRRKQKLSNYIFRMNRYQNEVYPSLQRDSSDVTDLCSRQPSIDRNKHCGPKRAWYYYDGLKDVCVRIKGCYAPGAFFTRRKDCNKSCLKPRKIAVINTSIEERNAICSMVPDDTSKCKKLRKVWYFDQQRGRCIKSKGCSFTGNTFRRRLTCKNMCKGRKSKKQERKQRIQFVS